MEKGANPDFQLPECVYNPTTKQRKKKSHLKKSAIQVIKIAEYFAAFFFVHSIHTL